MFYTSYQRNLDACNRFITLKSIMNLLTGKLSIKHAKLQIYGMNTFNKVVRPNNLSQSLENVKET